MKRPSDQAKLFLLGLLRTVSALATEPRVFSTASAYHHHPHHPAAHHVAVPHITLRLARQRDVPNMQRCNLASLPENYNQQFFNNHMRTWPELTIVAECTRGGMGEQQSPGGGGYSPFSPCGGGPPESQIVAYVLGKVEDRTVRTTPHNLAQWDQADLYRRNTMDDYDDIPPFTTERVGHVTSLAVLDGYRRQGLARELMNQLHYHLETCYGVDSVGLHVRQSNVPAERLYKRFGYQAAERIPGYYQDGEDAFFMKKRLGHSALYHQNNNNGRLFGGFRKSKPWETGPENVRLPRLVGKPIRSADPQESSSSPNRASPSPSAPELLTGSM